MKTDEKNRRKKLKHTPSKKWPNPTESPLELHACMGLNACKNHDVFGTNDCAGMGYCATQVHSCHTLNNCRGQGGCGLFGTTAEQCRPGENDCSFQGSCGTPIPAARFVTQGPNKGKAVWQIARELFAKRMEASNRTFGDAPMRYGPTQEFLNEVFSSDSSCGQSGEKYCSFGGPEAAKKRHEEFTKETAREINKIVERCEKYQLDE